MDFVEFYTKLTLARIKNGMDKETALSKVPSKYRQAVREAIENEEN